MSASFAFIGDVVIGEPKALIGFAGPRVIENTVREKLPEGFQRSEFLLSKGAIDMIVDRRKLRPTIAKLLAQLQRQSADAVAYMSPTVASAPCPEGPPHRPGEPAALPRFSFRADERQRRRRLPLRGSISP